jgi:DMSO/TMAO reductase YedYZ molybdopterin-dependent catalytic subunit
MEDDLTDEATYQRVRSAQGPSRLGDAQVSRRGLLQVSAGVGLGAAMATAAQVAPGAHAAAGVGGPMVKPLPPELFVVHGTNAEMRWESMAGQGHLTPADRFFVRNHTGTPLVDVRTWRLRLWGSGLHGSPPEERPVEFSYEDLLGMPAESLTAFIECTGNGRSFFTSQQGQAVSGTPWRLGAVGMARWRGVRLATVLERAGLTARAVDLMPRGLDAEFVDQGVNKGRVRRPLPVAKALEDVLLAYEMNGRPLPPDHGFPVRLVVPSWVGISSIKWIGDIQVADTPLFSPWNTDYYRLFGPGHPPEGSPPLTRVVVKSAFELPWEARLGAGRIHVLRGRSWSGDGRVRHVEVSTDGGLTWRSAVPHDPRAAHDWLSWESRWTPDRTGPHVLMARAARKSGGTQPDTVPPNTLGYLFGAVVRHPVTVV